MLKNMNRKVEENENLFGDSIESSEEKSVSIHEQQTYNHNIMITIPKFDSNVFLKYDYHELVKQKLEKLNIPSEEGHSNEKHYILNEKYFAEDNLPSGGIKSSGKKQIMLFKQLKNFIKSKDGSANTFLRSKFIEDQMDIKNQEKISSDDDEEEFENFSNNKFTRNFDLKSTLEELKREISSLSCLLKKKRENFDSKFTYSVDNQNLNEFDLFALRFNDKSDSCHEKSLSHSQKANHKSYKILYNKLKEFIFDNENKQSALQKINNINKRKIGITIEDILKIRKYQPVIMNIPNVSKYFEKLPFSEDYIVNGKGSGYIDNSQDNMKLRKKPTLSFIERQNKEALRAIEEKRTKYKHLPKANKEKMDNINLQKHWMWIIKKEIPKVYKVYQKFKTDIDYNSKRFSTLCQKEIRKKVSKTQRLQKESTLRGKRIQKEMLVFWRKRDKEILEIRKKKDKVETEKKKQEEELKEAVMQKKRLEYLMKQSDIYAHFMAKKLGLTEEEEKEKERLKEEENKEALQSKNIFAVSHSALNNITNANTEKKENKEINGPITVLGKSPVTGSAPNTINTITNHPLAKSFSTTGTGKIIFQSIKVDIDEKQAKDDLKKIINDHRDNLKQFDQETNKLRLLAGGEHGYISNLEKCKDDELEIERLDNPKIENAGSQLIEVPKSFMGELKEYQLKGLRWLDNLYSQGINGILADEMGLGKTIQAIALLAHISEEKNTWGPFLIIAPSSTLYNWQQEINRFCPTLKVLPYWGTLKDRKTLRKFLNPKYLYTRNSPFHVLITSYQLVVTDEKVFQRVQWQYMILDEAQAIKNINSQRWKILLGFNCRNRLLLTGTPIQNSMAELWALLHFIMPKLFDSHDQFQEWFSKDIEAHSQEKGELNQEQLRRLHAILKPFMLRRIKKDVENEIGPKVEHELFCEMTERQKVLYNTIKEKLSNISDLFTSVDSKVKVENLMNLVMQFRKVCNHPELFERHIGKVPFVFRDLIISRTATFLTPNSIAEVRTESTNCVKFHCPKLIYDMSMEFRNYFSIFKKNNIFESLKHKDSIFTFTNFFRFSINEFCNLIGMDSILTQLCLVHYLKEVSSLEFYLSNFNIFNNDDKMIDNNIEFEDNNQYNIFPSINRFKIKSSKRAYKNNFTNIFIKKNIIEEYSLIFKSNSCFSIKPLIFDNMSEIKESYLNKSLKKCRYYIPRVISSSIDFVCPSKRFYNEMKDRTNHILLNKILYSKTFSQYYSNCHLKVQELFRFKNISTSYYLDNLLNKGMITPIFYKNGGISQIELPDFQRLISDCAKLKKLDELLTNLAKNNHRVLIFCQMTRMIDILEEYMNKKRYIYFRMDGSTNIADRRDMVNEFQTNDKIFAFLLSTRAGGLGVNLTAADTVIFYDNDWNPTMDAQATDRAHRIGQSKVVNVFRLITKNTIEERILRRAKQKQSVQTTVYSGGAFKADIFKPREIVELLYGEEEMKNFELENKKILETNSLVNINSTVNTNNNNQGKIEKLIDRDDKSKKIKKIKKSTMNGISTQMAIKPTTSKNSNLTKTSTTKVEKKDIAVKALPSANISSYNYLNRNIFAVSAGHNKINPSINAMKCDSSDDENNVIIQENDNIHLNNINYNAEDGFDEDEV